MRCSADGGLKRKCQERVIFNILVASFSSCEHLQCWADTSLIWTEAKRDVLWSRHTPCHCANVIQFQNSQRKWEKLLFPTLAALRHDTHGALHCYSSRRVGGGYRNPSWYIGMRGGVTLATDCSSSSVGFLMLDLNVRVETVKGRLVAVHYTSNWKWLAAALHRAEYGTRAGVLYLTDDRLSNMPVVKIIIRKNILKEWVFFLFEVRILGFYRKHGDINWPNACSVHF